MQMTLDMDDARQRGEAGMRLAADNANICAPGWTVLALTKFREHVATLPADKQFIAEEVRLAIQSEIPEPFELRAWGQVIKSAIQQGILVATGETKPAVSSHSSGKPAYRRGWAA